MNKNLIVVAGALLAAGPAFAHVVVAPNKAEAGSYFAGAFRVGHGCQGQATTQVRIEFPPELASARPRPIPGWKHSIEYKDGAVTAITWKGKLPDEEFQQFEVLMKLPAKAGVLWFPTVQICGKAENRWTVIGDPSSSNPAPRLDVVPAQGEANAH